MISSNSGYRINQLSCSVCDHIPPAWCADSSAAQGVQVCRASVLVRSLLRIKLWSPVCGSYIKYLLLSAGPDQFDALDKMLAGALLHHSQFHNQFSKVHLKREEKYM